MLVGRRSAFAVVGEGWVGLDFVPKVGLESLVKMVVLIFAGGPCEFLSVSGRENDVRTGVGPKPIFSRDWKLAVTPGVAGNDTC